MHFLTVNIFLTFLRMNFWECAQRRSGNGCNVYSKTELTKQNQKTKLTELEYNILDVSNLAKKTTTIENKIPDVSSLVKKQTITLKLQKLKINIIMTNILILKSLTLQRLFLNRD